MGREQFPGSFSEPRVQQEQPTEKEVRQDRHVRRRSKKKATSYDEDAIETESLPTEELQEENKEDAHQEEGFNLSLEDVALFNANLDRLSAETLMESPQQTGEASPKTETDTEIATAIGNPKAALKYFKEEAAKPKSENISDEDHAAYVRRLGHLEDLSQQLVTAKGDERADLQKRIGNLMRGLSAFEERVIARKPVTEESVSEIPHTPTSTSLVGDIIGLKHSAEDKLASQPEAISEAQPESQKSFDEKITNATSLAELYAALDEMETVQGTHALSASDLKDKAEQLLAVATHRPDHFDVFWRLQGNVFTRRYGLRDKVKELIVKESGLAQPESEKEPLAAPEPAVSPEESFADLKNAPIVPPPETPLSTPEQMLELTLDEARARYVATGKEGREEAYEAYMEARAQEAARRVETKRHELEAGGLAPHEIEQKLNEFRSTTLFDEMIIGERERLRKLDLEGMPPKKRSILTKSLEWWGQQPPKQRRILSVSVVMLGAALFTPAAAAGTMGAVGYTAWKGARSLTSGFIGRGASTLTGKGYDKYIGRKKEEEASKHEEHGRSALKYRDAAEMKEAIEMAEGNYQSALHVRKKNRRNKVIAQVAAGLAAGLGTSKALEGGLAHIHHAAMDAAQTNLDRQEGMPIPETHVEHMVQVPPGAQGMPIPETHIPPTLHASDGSHLENAASMHGNIPDAPSPAAAHAVESSAEPMPASVHGHEYDAPSPAAAHAVSSSPEAPSKIFAKGIGKEHTPLRDPFLKDTVDTKEVHLDDHAGGHFKTSGGKLGMRDPFLKDEVMPENKVAHLSESIDAHHMTVINEHGNIWKATKELQRQLNLSKDEYSRAWMHSNLSDRNLVHAGDQLTYVPESNGVPAHFAFDNASGLPSPEHGMHIEHAPHATETPLQTHDVTPAPHPDPEGPVIDHDEASRVASEASLSNGHPYNFAQETLDKNDPHLPDRTEEEWIAAYERGEPVWQGFHEFMARHHAVLARAHGLNVDAINNTINERLAAADPEWAREHAWLLHEKPLATVEVTDPNAHLSTHDEAWREGPTLLGHEAHEYAPGIPADDPYRYPHYLEQHLDQVKPGTPEFGVVLRDRIRTGLEGVFNKPYEKFGDEWTTWSRYPIRDVMDMNPATLDPDAAPARFVRYVRQLALETRTTPRLFRAESVGEFIERAEAKKLSQAITSFQS